MDEHFDIVVVGAGLGGLSAAGHLAKVGKRVLVLEHHTVPGGYAHEFRRGRYRFEVALHALDGVAPGGLVYPALDELGVLERVKFNRLDPFFTAKFPEHELVVPADIADYETQMVRLFPNQAQGFRSLFDAMRAVYVDLRRFSADGELKRRPPMAKLPATYPHMISAMSRSWADFMDVHLNDAKAKALFSTLWGYYGLPPRRLNAATFIIPWVTYHQYGAYYPEGGSMALSRALEVAIVEHAGEVRYRQTVNHFDIQDGKVIAVETEAGLRVTADMVISNANPLDTMLRWVGKENLPHEYVNKIETDVPAASNLVLYLGLDIDLALDGWQDHERFIIDTYDLDADYDRMMAGDFANTGMVLTHYNHADPTCSPEGGSVLMAMTLAPWDYADQWGTGGDLENYGKNPAYLELKQDAGEALLARVEEEMPGIRQHIVHMEVGTPLTNVRYSRNPGGSIYGSEQTVENMYLGRLRERTPVDNLYLTGAWVMGGGMSAAILSGRNVARRVIARMDGEQTETMINRDDGSASPDVAQVSKPAATTAATVLDISGRSMPATTLTAAGSERTLLLNALPSTAFLIFHGENNTDIVSEANAIVRAEYPMPDQLLIASIVDLHHIPRMFRRMANRALKTAYQRSAELIPAELDPVQYVIILPDWDGSVTSAIGFDAVGEEAGIVVTDNAGTLLGAFQGKGAAALALACLKDAV